MEVAVVIDFVIAVVVIIIVIIVIIIIIIIIIIITKTSRNTWICMVLLGLLLMFRHQAAG